MISRFFEDAHKRPELFVFLGPIDPSWLENWLFARHFTIPDDLKSLWRETGGGDIFESETILSPSGGNQWLEDVDSVNEFHWRNGMPRDYLIFHTGLGGFTCLRFATGDYVNISEESYEIQQTFVSLAEWYERLIRKEYATRYKLSE